MRLVTEARTEQASARSSAPPALDTDVARLEDGARDLEARIAGAPGRHQRATRSAATSCAQSITRHRARCSTRTCASSTGSSSEVRGARRAVVDRAASRLRRRASTRFAARATRSKACAREVMQSEVARATAAADLAHLAAACFEAVGAVARRSRRRASRAWRRPASSSRPAGAWRPSPRPTRTKRTTPAEPSDESAGEPASSRGPTASSTTPVRSAPKT